MGNTKLCSTIKCHTVRSMVHLLIICDSAKITMFVILIMDFRTGFSAFVFWIFACVTTVYCAPIKIDADFKDSGIYHSAEIDFLKTVYSDIPEELVELNWFNLIETGLDLKQLQTNRGDVNTNYILNEEMFNLVRHFVEKALSISTTDSDSGSLKDAYKLLLKRLQDKLIAIDNADADISVSYLRRVSQLIQKELELLDDAKHADTGVPENSHSFLRDSPFVNIDNDLKKLMIELLRAYPPYNYEWKKSPTPDSNTIEEPILDIDIEILENTRQNGKNRFSLTNLYRNKGGMCTDIKGYAMSPIYTVATCPYSEIAGNILNLCENTELYSEKVLKQNVINIVNTPVQDLDGLVYRNLYCAQCNGVKNVEAWSMKLECDSQHSFEILDGNDEYTIMEEVDDEISTESKFCKKQLTPVTARMIHECAKSDIEHNIEYRQHDIRPGNPSRKSPLPMSFNVFINFDMRGKTHILFSTTHAELKQSRMCANSETYDPVNKKCRVIYCNKNFKLVDTTCKRIQNSGAMTDGIQNPGSMIVMPSTKTYPDIVLLEDSGPVVLTIRNISSGEIPVLHMKGIEELFVKRIADILNVSAEYIENLTLELVNMSSSMNDNSGNANEINPSTTRKSVHHSTMKPSSETAIEPQSNTMKARSRNRTVPLVVYTKAPIYYHRDPVTVASTDISLVTRNFTDNNTSEPQKTTEHSNYLHNLGQVHPTYKSKTDNPFSTYLNVSVKISFTVKEPYKNRALQETSLSNVVDMMNTLDSFHLIVNGTDFTIHTIENALKPHSPKDFCKKGTQSYYMNDDVDVIRVIEPERDINEARVYIHSTGRFYNPGEYDVTVILKATVGDLPRMKFKKHAYVCDMPRITNEECVRIVLNKSEYEMLANKSVKFVDNIFNTSEYEYDCERLDSVRICAPDWSTSQMMTNGAKWTLACGEDLIKLVLAESYLSFILGVISLIAMLSVLLTYGLFEILRNLPGINMINLTLSLFFGKLVFIVSGWTWPQEEWFCSGVGMLLHYLFLTSFFWMNVMSFDLYKTFAQTCILRRIRSKEKYMLRYLLYAWGSPMMIVAACAFIDFSGLFGTNPVGYGGGNFAASSPSDWQLQLLDNDTNVSSSSQGYNMGCWIQRPVASMTAFGGPMMLILFSNAIMFTRTITNIRASTKATKLRVRKSNRISGQYDVMLYVRMSTVMGFTWILGLASSVVSAFTSPTSRIACIVLHTLGILFILFNCSQGLFIFFVFVCNRRVVGLYRGLVAKLKTHRHQTVSVYSSRGTMTTNENMCSVNTVCAKM